MVRLTVFANREKNKYECGKEEINVSLRITTEQGAKFTEHTGCIQLIMKGSKAYGVSKLPCEFIKQVFIQNDLLKKDQ